MVHEPSTIRSSPSRDLIYEGLNGRPIRAEDLDLPAEIAGHCADAICLCCTAIEQLVFWMLARPARAGDRAPARAGWAHRKGFLTEFSAGATIYRICGRREIEEGPLDTQLHNQSLGHAAMLRSCQIAQKK